MPCYVLSNFFDRKRLVFRSQLGQGRTSQEPQNAFSQDPKMRSLFTDLQQWTKQKWVSAPAQCEAATQCKKNNNEMAFGPLKCHLQVVPYPPPPSKRHSGGGLVPRSLAPNPRWTLLGRLRASLQRSLRLPLRSRLAVDSVRGSQDQASSLLRPAPRRQPPPNLDRPPEGSRVAQLGAIGFT